MIEFLEKIRYIYEEAFPIDERRDFKQLTDIFDLNKNIGIEPITENDRIIGFIIYWIFDSFVYIEHFAVDKEKRGNGIGTEILKRFIAKTDRPIVLEAELPTDKISTDRITFYQRLGFELHNYKYIQPAYDADRNPIELCLMSHSMTSNIPDLDTVRDTLYQYVYGIVI